MEDTTAFLNGDLHCDDEAVNAQIDGFWNSPSMDSVRPQRGPSAQARKFFSILVINLVLADDEPLAVPRDRNAWEYRKGRYNNNGLTSNSIKYQDSLDKAGLLLISKGSFETRKCTTVRPLGALEELVSRLAPLKHCIVDNLERIEVRGPGGRLEYDDNQNTNTWRETLRAHADLMAAVEVTVRKDGAAKPTVIPSQAMVYRRLFTRGSWDCGARIYCHNIQNLRGKSVGERQSLTFDGQPTAEPDFSGQHPRILYILGGSPRPADEDMYSAWMNVETRSTADLSITERRSLAKQLMLCSLNAKSREGACGAAGKELRKEGYKIRPADIRRLYDAMADHHSAIAQHFSSDIGIRLQRVDSDIMLLVMAEMTHRGVPCLSVHDSLICKEEDECLAVSLMAAVSDFYLGEALPVDSNAPSKAISLTSPLFDLERAFARRCSEPIGLYRLRNAVVPIEEGVKDRRKRLRDLEEWKATPAL